MPSDQPKSPESKGKTRVAIGLGLAFLATLALLYALLWDGPSPTATTQAMDTKITTAPLAPSTQTTAADQPDVSAAQSTVTKTQDPQPQAAEPVQTATAEPNEQPRAVAHPGLFIDVLRLDADGQLLIAGRGAPQAALRVRMEGATLVEGQSDGAGQFALFAVIEPSADARVIQVQQQWQGAWGAIMAEAVIDGMPVQLAEAPAAEPAAQDTPSDTSLAPTPEPSGGSTVIISDTDGVRVAPQGQTDAPAQGETVAEVFILAISYDAAGQAIVQGRASTGAAVRVYVNGDIKATAPLAEDGQWTAVLQNVVPGIYQLRADLLDGEGQVIARAQTPFKREGPQAVASAQTGEGLAAEPTAEAAAGAADLPARQITVQPGATLWAISRARYGEGIRYLAVFEANKNQIRDPDLIYPGQVFTLPELPSQQ